MNDLHAGRAARSADLVGRIDAKIVEVRDALVRLQDLRDEAMFVDQRPVRHTLRRMRRAVTLRGVIDLLLCWSAAILLAQAAGLIPRDPASLPVAADATLVGGTVLFVVLHFRAVKRFFLPNLK